MLFRFSWIFFLTCLLCIAALQPSQAWDDIEIERIHREAERQGKESQEFYARQPEKSLPVKRGRGWQKTFEGISYGITKSGVKWIDAGYFATAKGGARMCVSVEGVKYCF